VGNGRKNKETKKKHGAGGEAYAMRKEKKVTVVKEVIVSKNL